jgi:serine/threonine protein phosphatase PrpC
MKAVNEISDSFKGTTHTENQDDLLIVRDVGYVLYVIFDGVSMSENQTKGIQIAGNFITGNHMNYLNDRREGLKQLMMHANDAIVSSEWEDALTTYCAVVVYENHDLCMSHLGDSRIYTLINGNRRQRTQDDVIFPGSNILTRCLGLVRNDSTGFYQRNLPVDHARVLLCTDGFVELMESNEDEFTGILSLSELEQVKRRLKKAIAGRNRDDASYILFDFI